MEKNIFLELENSDDYIKIIDEYYPGWFVSCFDSYSVDYPNFRINWEKICHYLDTFPKKIIIVRDIPFENAQLEKEIMKNKLCEYLTTKGYCVRRQGEFIGCSVCSKAIPSKDIWQLLKDKNVEIEKELQHQIPEIWTDKCSHC